MSKYISRLISMHLDEHVATEDGDLAEQFESALNLEVHTGYKSYICGLCGKAFARKAEIRDQLITNVLIPAKGRTYANIAAPHRHLSFSDKTH